jgi:hypothetical protein
MRGPADVRFAILNDEDLSNFVERVARKRWRDAQFAKDVRQDAFLIAIELLAAGKEPPAGMLRGWMCEIARRHAFEELRRKKKEPQPHETDDEPVIPVEDQQTLYEAQSIIEQRYDVLEQVAADNPEDVARVLDADGRTKEGAEAAPKDAAARKKKERSRAALASGITTALVAAAAAAAIFFLVLRPKMNPPPGLPPGGYATLADASHELAHQACAASEWVDCLEQLDHMRRLDVTKFGPDEQKAWDSAAAGLRREAAIDLAKNEDPLGCLEKLDTARRYDPKGDLEETVTLLRLTAQQKLGAAQPQPFRAPDVKRIPPR